MILYIGSKSALYKGRKSETKQISMCVSSVAQKQVLVSLGNSTKGVASAGRKVPSSLSVGSKATFVLDPDDFVKKLKMASPHHRDPLPSDIMCVFQWFLAFCIFNDF
jgi:hypothetical protein